CEHRHAEFLSSNKKGPPDRTAEFSAPVRLAACQPTRTVGKPATIEPPCPVGSPSRPAGIPPINTVGDPGVSVSGGPTQTAMSVARAAGIPPIRTVGQPGPEMGPPTCGTTPVTSGQTCISVK